MSKSVRVPDPVHERAAQEAEERDVSIRAVIEDWMQDHDRFEKLIEQGRVEFEVE
jgi:predicted HicB family RNase H-like nuclease